MPQSEPADADPDDEPGRDDHKILSKRLPVGLRINILDGQRTRHQPQHPRAHQAITALPLQRRAMRRLLWMSGGQVAG